MRVRDGTHLVAVLLVCSLVLGAAPSAAAQEGTGSDPVAVRSCGVTITEPGTYVLTRSIIDDRGVGLSENCITIESSDVILDGGGHTVDGNGVTDTTGIAVANDTRLSNVTVRDVTVSDWDRGLHYENVSNGTVSDVNASLNAFGITLTNATGIDVRSPTVTNNLIGVFLDGTADSAVRNVTADGNQVTVKVDEDSENNTVPDSGVQWNRRVDVLAELGFPLPHGFTFVAERY